MITAVLFDLDGTLTNSLPLIRRTYKKVFRDMGLSWDETNISHLVSLPLREIGKKFAGEHKEQEFFDRYQHFYRQEHDEYIHLFPGTEDMLNALQAHYKLGIVTSKSRIGTEMTVEFLNLAKWFSPIITADDVKNHKPHPEPVIKALNALEAEPNQAVFIGDSPLDIQAGNSAGVSTIAVSWGMVEETVLIKHAPDYVASTREELLSIITQLT